MQRRIWTVTITTKRETVSVRSTSSPAVIRGADTTVSPSVLTTAVRTTSTGSDSGNARKKNRN